MSLFEFSGIIVHGNKRGKQLGFPTANILLPSPIPEGIYISSVIYDGGKYKALTFIGASKTFGDVDVISETYILDFERDIYGEKLDINLLKKIRSNEKFNGVDALIKQMKDDRVQAIEYFEKNPLV